MVFIWIGRPTQCSRASDLALLQKSLPIEGLLCFVSTDGLCLPELGLQNPESPARALKARQASASAAQPCCLRRSVHLPTSQRSRPPRLPQLLTEVLERRLSVGAVSQQSGVFNCFLNAFRACVARGCAVLQQGCKSGLRRSNLPHVLGELEVSISPENISKDGPPQKFQVKNPL